MIRPFGKMFGAVISRGSQKHFGPGTISHYPISGPQGLRLIKGFYDEGLSGERKGHRSSRLGQQYRAIYWIEKDLIRVEVVSVTAHDYRRR
jgi:hypothetical protein